VLLDLMCFEIGHVAFLGFVVSSADEVIELAGRVVRCIL
jgi:hypothetical protein